MRILSAGAGAVGGTVAARLRRAGADVRVFDTNAGHVALIASEGLRIDGLEGETSVVLPASTQPPADVFDLVLLAVRSSDTDEALSSLSAAIGPATDVVSLQNGLNEDRIAAAVGPQRTIGCVVGFGATWIAPGRVALDSAGDLTCGRLDGSADGRLDAARDVLDLAFPTRITPNIRGALWAKMLVNSMTVMGALGGMLTGALLSTPQRRMLVADVVAEGARVARACGVELLPVFGAVDPSLVDDGSWHEVMDRVLVRVRETFGAIRSVTWRDFELGRPTEIDAVTGEIVRRGGSCGVATPLNTAIYAMLREIERGERTPGARNLDALPARP